MAISGSELLDVLDIIRNEETYNEKIKELKAEQQRLNESKYIAKTVEVANKYYEKAKLDRDKYAKQLEEAKIEAAKIVKDAKEEMSNLRSQAVKKLEEASQVKKEADEHYEKIKKEREEFQCAKEQAEKEKTYYQNEVLKTQKLQDDLYQKIKQLKAVIG